jgi:deazaflavin-dependent oxidoreductase (nitroreductase family)
MTPPKPMLRFFSRVHTKIYRRWKGRYRNVMNGLPVLLLTTTGRKTGQPYTVPIVYLVDGDGYLIAPGVVPCPDWYLNLKNKPRAEIQVGEGRLAIEAEELTGPARDRLWTNVPDYWKKYEKRAGSPMPLIRLFARLGSRHSSWVAAELWPFKKFPPSYVSRIEFPAKTGQKSHDNGTPVNVRCEHSFPGRESTDHNGFE